MPTSPPHKLWPVLSIVQEIDVKKVNSILDIGIGFGKLGVCLREHFDARVKRYRKADWKVKIDGVEIWSDYISPVHQYIYDCIYLGDIRKIAPTLPNYDLIFMSEVLEHLEKGEGKETLNTLYKKCNFGMSLSFPWVFKEGQGGDWPNPYEEHKCLWTSEEVEKMFPNVKAVKKLAVHILR